MHARLVPPRTRAPAHARRASAAAVPVGWVGRRVGGVVGGGRGEGDAGCSARGRRDGRLSIIAAAGMASSGRDTAGRPDRHAYEWDRRQRECQRSVCLLSAHPAGCASLAQCGTGWVVRNDPDVAAMVTARHVLEYVINGRRVTGLVSATFPDGRTVDLAGACVLSAPEPGTGADPSPEMDTVVVRLAAGQQYPAPPVPCALASGDADGSEAADERGSALEGASCTLLHHPRGHKSVVVTPRGTVFTVVEGGGQPWCVTHNLESDGGSSGGMLIDAQGRAFAIHCAREAADVKHAMLLSALHVGLGEESPWLGAPPVEHGRDVVYGLPPRCGNFVGRVDALAALSRAVKDDGLVVVVSTGLPGVGKSTLVGEWARQASQSREYGAVLWLRADTIETLCDDLVELGEMLHMPLGHVAGRPVDERAAFVKRTLGNASFFSGLALFVLDNADDYTVVRDFVPTGRDFRVVFTARDRLTYAGHCVLPLQPFAAHESMELLCAIVARPIEGDEKAIANELCEEVGHLPLAVQLLALYAKESGANLADLLRGVRRSAESAGPLASIIIATYARRESVIGALKLVQGQLSEPSRRVLQRLALLAPERVPRELLGPSAEAATLELSSLAMITYPGPGLVSAHRLVLRVALARVSDSNEDLLTATRGVVAELANHVVGFDIDNVATWGPTRAILPHAEALAESGAAVSLWKDDTMAKKWLWVLKVLYWYTEGCIRSYTTAARWAYRGKADAAILFPNSSSKYLGRSVDVAYVLALQGKRDEALLVGIPLLAPVAERVAGPDDHLAENDPDHAKVVAFNLARTLRKLDRRKDALELLIQLKSVTMARYGGAHTLGLSVRAEMAFLLQQEGNVNQAVTLLEEVLRDAEATVFPASFSAYQLKLARMYYLQGELEKSLHLYTQARDKSAASLGEGHFQVALAEHQMGLVHRQLGNLDTAEELFRASLRKQDMLGSGDPQVQTTERALVDVQWERQFIESMHQRRRAGSADAALDTAGPSSANASCDTAGGR